MRYFSNNILQKSPGRSLEFIIGDNQGVGAPTGSRAEYQLESGLKPQKPEKIRLNGSSEPEYCTILLYYSVTPPPLH